MKRFIRIVLMTTAIVAWLGTLLGCGGCGLTPVAPKDADAPVQGDEECGYLMAQLHHPGAQDILIGSETQFSYAMQTMRDYFRDRSEPTDRFMLSVVGGPRTVVYEARPKTVKKDFATPDHVKAFLARQGTGGKQNTYQAVADVFDYIGKFHLTGKSAVLVFSPMRYDGPEEDRAASRARLVGSVRDYARKPRTYCAFYGIPWNEVKEFEAIMSEAHVGTGNFVPDARRDPVRKTYE